MPPTINSFNNSSVDLFKSEKFYQDINNTEDKEKSYIMNCLFVIIIKNQLTFVMIVINIFVMNV